MRFLAIILFGFILGTAGFQAQADHHEGHEDVSAESRKTECMVYLVKEHTEETGHRSKVDLFHEWTNMKSKWYSFSCPNGENKRHSNTSHCYNNLSDDDANSFVFTILPADNGNVYYRILDGKGRIIANQVLKNGLGGKNTHTFRQDGVLSQRMMFDAQCR